MESALKSRIITGVILAVAVLLGVLLLPNNAFALLALLVLVGIGGWEWARLVSFDGRQQILFVAILLATSLLLYLYSDQSTTFTIIGLIWWFAVLVILATYEQGTLFYKQQKWVLRLAAFLVLIPAWLALINLHQYSPKVVVYLIFLVAIADSGAYFSGKAFGKNKLAPELSPGKTREGMFGGLIGATIWAILATQYFKLPASDWLYFILLSIGVAAFSVVGDLFESLIKRESGQKDSGNILPGHGGILDRVDGLLAALPVFAMGIFWGGLQL